MLRRSTCGALAATLALCITPLIAQATTSSSAPATVTDSAASAPNESSPGPAVTIKRDSYGVPHVYASTTRDLFRGYGFAVAQDRLFQMEMSRRSTQGLVSEVLGPDYLALDKDTRTGSDPGSIHRQLAQLPLADRQILQGYADGMNSWITKVNANPDALMPREFRDYGFEPSRWSAYDVAMVWIGTMANRYSDSTSEIPNYAMLQTLIAANGETKGRALFDQLQWLEDPLAPTTVPRGAAAAHPASAPKVALAPLAAGVRDVGVEMMKRNGAGMEPNAHPTASNIWIIGKDRAVGAKSILYNGPQFSWFNPSYVYGIGLHGAGYDFAGTTPFAYPAVIFGTNNDISWGATAGALNLVDMYQETLNPDNPRQYLYKGAWRDMTSRVVTISVKGAAAVQHEILYTVHGAVTSVDAANHRAYSKKRSWSGYEVQSLIAWTKLPTARSFADFQRLASQFKTTINWYYADRKGNIGYVAPGLIPTRPANQDMRIPANGDGTMEWTGFLDPSQNPHTYNPAQGFIANWNNQTAAGFNSDFGNWSVVDRVQEIDDALDDGSRLTADQMVALNERFSFVDLNLRYVLPTLKKAVTNVPYSSPLRADVNLLASWDGQTRDGDADGFYDGPQPAIMRAWLPLLFQKVLSDDLPASVYASYTSATYPTGVEPRFSIRPSAAMKLTYNAILGERAGVPQTYDLFNGADPRGVLLETYEAALASLRSTQGSDMSGWKVPIATHLFNSKNFLGVPQTTPDRAIAGPQYMNRGTANILVVLGQGQPRLCISAPPGQSGFVSPAGVESANYRDQLALWTAFDCREEHLSAQVVDRASVGVTRLW